VRGRADRVGSLADGQGDRNGPLAPPGAGRRCRSAGSGDVPGPAGQGETLHGESPNEFRRSRVVEHDDHVDLGNGANHQADLAIGRFGVNPFKNSDFDPNIYINSMGWDPDR
jgi:hypothetical protein